MSDIQTIVWKEWRELLRMSGSPRGAIARHLSSVVLLSILWPWQFGLRFLHTGLAAVLAASTAAIYIAGASPDSFAGERERHTLETLLASRVPDRAIIIGKILALLEYGCLAAFVVLVFGWITVNLVHGSGQLLWYSREAIIGSVVFTPLFAGLVASVGIHVSLRAKTVKQAQQTLSTAMLVVVFLPIIALAAVGPEAVAPLIMRLKSLDWETAVALLAVAMLVAQAVLFGLAVARFRRAKLIL
jgi:ABC-2 type transport system permease protein